MVGVDPQSPVDGPTFDPRGAGVPPQLLEQTLMLPYWNEAAFEIIRAHRDELAAVLVEPVQGSNPQSKQGAWLRQLAEACSEAGVLLLFDEVITGFRLGYGGGQEAFGVGADLIAYGKVLGGGMPVSAITGRAEIMQLFATGSERYVFSTGTFSGNPIGMLAGAAVLEHLRDNPDQYAYLNEQSQRLADELNAYCLEHELPAQVLSSGSIQFLRLQAERSTIRTGRDAARSPLGPKAAEALQLDLLSRGVIMPGTHQFHLSTAHSPEDVDYVISSCQAALQGLRRHGWLQ
jgi:glutamate-1-semialdehyde aminotransferase